MEQKSGWNPHNVLFGLRVWFRNWLQLQLPGSPICIGVLTLLILRRYRQVLMLMAMCNLSSIERKRIGNEELSVIKFVMGEIRVY